MKLKLHLLGMKKIMKTWVQSKFRIVFMNTEMNNTLICVYIDISYYVTILKQ